MRRTNSAAPAIGVVHPTRPEPQPSTRSVAAVGGGYADDNTFDRRNVVITFRDRLFEHVSREFDACKLGANI